MNKIIPVWFSFYILLLLLLFFLSLHIYVCVDNPQLFFSSYCIFQERKKKYSQTISCQISESINKPWLWMCIYANNRIIYIVRLFFFILFSRRKKKEMCDNNRAGAWRWCLSFFSFIAIIIIDSSVSCRFHVTIKKWWRQHR
jgi:hypothetical protein